MGWAGGGRECVTDGRRESGRQTKRDPVSVDQDGSEKI